MITKILIILILLIAVLLFIHIVQWATHVQITKEDSETYGYATYSKFVEEFEKVNWDYDSGFDGLYGEYGVTDMFQFDGEICFKGNGMVISNPLSYLFVKIYVKEYIKKMRNSNKLKKDKKVINEWRA